MDRCNILNFGIFDSKKIHPTISETHERTVECFEFDYIISCDKGSVSYINSVSEPLFPGLLVIRKPRDVSHSKYHFKCYALHMTVQKDSSLYSDFIALPSFLPITNAEIYQSIFSDMFRHLIKTTGNYKSYYTYSKLFELIYNMKKDAERTQNTGSASHRRIALSIQNSIDYMKKNFSDSISIKTLADLTGYSPNHFRTFFASTMNISPQKFLEKIRIDNAKFLLVQNELSIAEIAYACGFSSQSYFTKAFKEATMQTPGEFLKTSFVKYDENE